MSNRDRTWDDISVGMNETGTARMVSGISVMHTMKLICSLINKVTLVLELIQLFLVGI